MRRPVIPLRAFLVASSYLIFCVGLIAIINPIKAGECFMWTLAVCLFALARHITWE